MRHARASMHVGIANPRWRGKRSRHSWRMRNLQYYVCGKRPVLYCCCRWWQIQFRKYGFTSSVGNTYLYSYWPWVASLVLVIWIAPKIIFPELTFIVKTNYYTIVKNIYYNAQSAYVTKPRKSRLIWVLLCFIASVVRKCCTHQYSTKICSATIHFYWRHAHAYTHLCFRAHSGHYISLQFKIWLEHKWLKQS